MASAAAKWIISCVLRGIDVDDVDSPVDDYRTAAVLDKLNQQLLSSKPSTVDGLLVSWDRWSDTLRMRMVQALRDFISTVPMESLSPFHEKVMEMLEGCPEDMVSPLIKFCEEFAAANGAEVPRLISAFRNAESKWIPAILRGVVDRDSHVGRHGTIIHCTCVPLLHEWGPPPPWN